MESCSGGPCKVELRFEAPIALRCLLFLPDKYRHSELKWRAMLYPHRKREQWDDLKLVKKHCMAKIAAEQHEFPFVVASPQCPEGAF